MLLLSTANRYACVSCFDLQQDVTDCYLTMQRALCKGNLEAEVNSVSYPHLVMISAQPWTKHVAHTDKANGACADGNGT